MRPQMVVVSLTWERHATFTLQSSQRECYLVANMQRLRFGTRDEVTMRAEAGSISVVQEGRQ